MKKTRIFWGISLLLVAALLILDVLGVSLGLPENLPVWRIILAAIFFCAAIDEVIKGRIHGIFFPLTFIVILFEKELAALMGIESSDIASFWVFMLIALLLTIGFSLVCPNFHRKNKSKIVARGNRTVYIDCNNPINETIENSLGACDVFFANSNLYDGTGHLCVENNMGRTVVHIPADWYVISNMENHMGSVNIPPQKETEGGKRLTLTGENNMGAVQVVFVEPFEG